MTDDPRVNIRFCPTCGASDWETRVPRRDDKPRPCCRPCGYVHYVGPSLAAGIVLSRKANGAVEYCLVRRAHNPGKGLWSFPGGFVDLDERAEDAAIREALEETGCTAEIDSILGVYNSIGPGGKRVAIVVFVGRVTAEGESRSEEVAELAWFKSSAVPWGEFAFDDTAIAFRQYVERASLASSE